MSQNNYFSGLLSGVRSLATGLGVTMRELFTPKVTEQYPENRAELKMFDRYRGRLIMPHNEKNEHKCVACHLCEMACPNGSITVIHEMYDDEDGRKKRRLQKYEYDLGCCMFCELCVMACPHGAITFSTDFENAVFDRTKLVMQLNHPGSHVEEKKPVARPAAVKPTTANPATAAAPANQPSQANPANQPGRPNQPSQSNPANQPVPADNKSQSETNSSTK